MKHITVIGGVLIALAGVLGATSTQETTWAMVLPEGNWTICAAAPATPMCEGYKAGESERYMLELYSNSPATIAFEYVVTGELSSGATVTITGTVDRNEEVRGFTIVSLNFGGAVKNVKIAVKAQALR